MSSRRRRLTIGALVVLAWATTTALLVRRELGGRRPTAELATSNAPARLAYALLDGAGRRVGTLRFARHPERRGETHGTVGRFALDAAFPVLGRASAIDLEGELFRPAGDGPIAIAVTLRSAGHDLRMDGEVADGELRATLETAGESLPIRLPLGDDLLLGGGLGPSLELPWLAVGESVTLPGFDPLTLDAGRVRVRAVALETLPLAGGAIETQVLQVASGGLESRVWIDRQGLVVRAETPLGLVLERLPESGGLTDDDDDDDAEAEPDALAAAATGDVDLVERVAVRPTGARPFRGARELVVRLSGPPALVTAGGVPTGDGLQEDLGDGRYRITVNEPTASPDGGGTADLAPYLRADPFVQSDHPRIRDRARRIVGDERDPWARARLLHDWVYERLDKEPVMSLPSALEVLAERRGDCNEHAVLYTALARAAGLPARVAVGVVWSDEYDGFYYHAWPEVHVGRWVRTDPTLGQPVADATHLALTRGGIETWPRLVPWLGRLEIAVEEVR